MVFWTFCIVFYCFVSINPLYLFTDISLCFKLVIKRVDGMAWEVVCGNFLGLWQLKMKNPYHLQTVMLTLSERKPVYEKKTEM